MVLDENTMLLYIFGGLTNDNHTLNDMWLYDLTEKKWTKVDQRGTIPKPRAGHSMNLYEGKIFMFGGLIEVTQESSELFLFDIESYTWTLLKSEEIEDQQAKILEKLNAPVSDSFNDNRSSEKDKKSSYSNREEQIANKIRRRNIRSAMPGSNPISSMNVGAINSDVQSFNETVTSFGTRQRVNSLNKGYTTSCRAIVMN